MRKNEAKQIVTDIYHEVIAHIDEKEDENIDDMQIIDFLHDIARSLYADSFKRPLNLYTNDPIFEKEYKWVAKESLNAYKSTNEAMLFISQEQQELIDKTRSNLIIDHSVITDKLINVQNHMTIEIDKANKTISSLLHQIGSLESKSRIDPLTNVFNRRAMDEYMSAKCDYNKKADHFHLLMIDIDNFKVINDSFGHVAGDKVLIFLANIFKKTIREGDHVFRYGGEEFIIILSRTDQSGARNVANRILELVRNNKLLFQNQQMSITLSIGLANCKADDTPFSIIDRADKALYEAKENGKNQLAVAKG